MKNLVSELETALSSLRQAKPLVLCLTNFVTMDLVANSLYALGAAPLMSQSLDEFEELIALSSAVYINLGTLDQAFCERALEAARQAKLQSKPLVLDPVGAGASRLRTEAAQSLVPYADIIRGNASEILALADNLSETRGVEAAHSVNHAAIAAKKWAYANEKVVVVSGPIDLIINGRDENAKELNLPFGSPLMPLITGMGCSLSAVVAAFAALDFDAFKASCLAAAYFSLCGQQSAQQTQLPGTFRELFLNSLFKPDWALFKDFVHQDGINK